MVATTFQLLSASSSHPAVAEPNPVDAPVISTVFLPTLNVHRQTVAMPWMARVLRPARSP